ncbi:MAG: heme-binding protein [Anaerocolumna sp.]
MPDRKTDKNNLSEIYQDLDGLAGFIDGILEKSGSTDLNNNLRLMKHKLLKTKTRVIESVVRDVMKVYLPPGQEEIKPDINLDQAVALIKVIEEKAADMGMAVVIAVYNSAARPVAIHCMDNSYIASFDVAENKAYTSAALKMSTAVLKNLSQPGQELYGIQHTNQGKIVIIGGGEPLIYQGEIIGALGVSGGTEEQDRDLAVFGRNKLEEVMTWQ